MDGSGYEKRAMYYTYDTAQQDFTKSSLGKQNQS
jgi:hypothetical protein